MPQRAMQRRGQQGTRCQKSAEGTANQTSAGGTDHFAQYDLT